MTFNTRTVSHQKFSSVWVTTS